MTQEALKQMVEALEESETDNDTMEFWGRKNKAIQAGKQALAELESQEPVAYDKTEMNCFVQDLYDQKMQEGKHGHYETMFHVVHQAIKRATPPQRTWVGLTGEQKQTAIWTDGTFGAGALWAEAKLKEKSND
jgi:hypothetical protein